MDDVLFSVCYYKIAEELSSLIINVTKG